jgi:CRP-like cAMP-binding protein
MYAELRSSDPMVCRNLFKLGRQFVLRRGDIAYRQDDVSTYVYLVISGGVLLTRGARRTISEPIL